MSVTYKYIYFKLNNLSQGNRAQPRPALPRFARNLAINNSLIIYSKCLMYFRRSRSEEPQYYNVSNVSIDPCHAAVQHTEARAATSYTIRLLPKADTGHITFFMFESTRCVSIAATGSLFTVKSRV